MSPPTTGTVASPSTLGADIIARPSPIESPESHAPAQAKTVAGGCLSVVILGASGDLAKKKTFPAIFNLYKQVFLFSVPFQVNIILLHL